VKLFFCPDGRCRWCAVVADFATWICGLIDDDPGKQKKKKKKKKIGRGGESGGEEGRKEGRKVLKVLLWSLVLDADEQTGDGGVAAALSGVQLSCCCCCCYS
jgi:hypothetical protein